MALTSEFFKEILKFIHSNKSCGEILSYSAGWSSFESADEILYEIKLLISTSC